MEPMLFSIVLLFFYVPAITLLIVGLIFYRKKLFRKTVIILGLVCLCMPWLIVGVIDVNDSLTIKSFQGVYTGKDQNLNTVNVNINDDETFNIKIGNCNEPKVTGTYQYVSDYDAFLFYGDNCKISIHENLKAELLLNCEKENSCYNLDDVKLVKIE